MVQRKSDCHTFTTSKRCILLKSTMGRSAVVSCACHLMLLFCVVFCLVTTVNRAYFWSCYKLNTKQMATGGKWLLLQWRTRFWEDLYVLSGRTARIAPACKVKKLFPSAEDRRDRRIARVLVPVFAEGKHARNALIRIVYRRSPLTRCSVPQLQLAAHCLRSWLSRESAGGW